MMGIRLNTWPLHLCYILITYYVLFCSHQQRKGRLFHSRKYSVEIFGVSKIMFNELAPQGHFVSGIVNTCSS